MRLAQRAAWLLAAPWRLVALVAIVAVLPILVVGEAAAADTTARHEAAAAETAHRVAASAAASFAERVAAVSLAVGNAATRPNTGKATPLIDAIERGDEKAAQLELEEMHRLIDPAVAWLLVVDGRSQLIAADPFAAGVAGTDLSPLISPTRGSARIEVGDALAWRDDLILKGPQRGSGIAATWVAIGVTAPIGTTQAAGYRLVAVAKLSTLAGAATSQLRTAYQDAYLVDRGGHLALRASNAFSPDDLAYRDLSGSPAVASLASGVSDPLEPGRVVRGAARAPDIGWSVLLVDRPTAIDADLDAALGQQRALRLGLAGVLLIGAALVGSASATAIRRRRETTEALEQQTAVSEVLKSINASGFDLGQVLQTVTEHATRLSGATQGILYRRDGGVLLFAAGFGPSHELMELNRRNPIAVGDRGTLTGRVAVDRRTTHIADVLDDPEYTYHEAQRLGGFRAMLGVPLMSGDELLGAMSLWRMEPVPFNDRQIAIVDTFARQAAVAIQNVRLFTETKEALEQQTATSDVLKTISRSAFDLQAVFDVVVENATKLCRGDWGYLFRRDGDVFKIVSSFGGTDELVAYERAHPTPLSRSTLIGRVALDREVVHIPDLFDDPAYDWPSNRAAGVHTVLGVPIFKDNEVVGAIGVARNEKRPFSEGEIRLVRTFADQAAIAMENVRLFNETKESLSQQTALSDVLRTISRSAFDLDAVLQTIVERAAALGGADAASIFGRDADDAVVLAQFGRVLPASMVLGTRIPVGSETVVGRALSTGQRQYVPDAVLRPELPQDGPRTRLAIPLLRDGKAIGVLGVSRKLPQPFSDRDLQMLETFADQAAIAMENVRLFNETKEALERQTSISDVLQTIGRSAFDLQPVLDAVVERAVRLCDAREGSISTLEGDVYRTRAFWSATPLAPEYIAIMRQEVRRPERGSLIGRTALEGRVVQIADALADPEYTVTDMQQVAGFRTLLGVPLLRDGKVIGVFALTRDEVRPFTDRQIELVRTFADQAAIAIENTRLFVATKEALEQQTAVADVLKTISRSVFDLQPVLDIVLNNAVRLAGADIGWLSRAEGDQFMTVAYSTAFPEHVREELAKQRQPGHLGGGWVPVGIGGGVMGVTLGEGRTMHVRDVKEDSRLKGSLVARLTDSRTVVGVPMLREGHSIGGMVLARYEVRPYTEREIELVQTFADQAAIAIENVRLFNQTKEALQQQTAVSDVLKTISRSAFDLNRVLATVVENAARLSDADLAWMGRADAGDIRGGGAGVRWARDGDTSWGGPGGFRGTPSRGSIMGRAFLDRRTIHVDDITADEELAAGSERARLSGSRTVLAVPLLVEGSAIGVILVGRRTVRRFSDREVQIVETFADQAAIAIQNVRLFNEIQDKSQQLEIASRHKSEFLANMSHELRTPLNAIIGFSEVLLQGIFGDMNEKQREYLTDVLGSGQHLLSLINDILDLSKIEAGRMDLELTTFAMRDALESGLTIIRDRAARHGIQLSTTVAPDVGSIEADERKVKQILYNLLSNAVKFTPDGGRVDVSVRAENGDVRVAVQDTGIGVAPEDQERIFEEFRQVGRERSREGTGLGLTLTKRFVELHGGRIWLESTPGKGSTFAFTLPLRRAAPVTA